MKFCGFWGILIVGFGLYIFFFSVISVEVLILIERSFFSVFVVVVVAAAVVSLE